MTYNFLKDKYYWRNMLNHIEKIVKKCDKCHRHFQEKPTKHPAKASEVLGLGDKIGIDLTFWLHDTTDGYKGLLWIIEHLSKYPYAVPIKSKSAEKIAEKLKEYFMIFGTPKIMLSDFVSVCSFYV